MSTVVEPPVASRSASPPPPPRKGPGDKVGKLTAEQAQIATLRRELAKANKRLSTTEAALDIMGKAHALLESLSESADSDDKNNKR